MAFHTCFSRAKGCRRPSLVADALCPMAASQRWNSKLGGGGIHPDYLAEGAVRVLSKVRTGETGGTRDGHAIGLI